VWSFYKKPETKLSTPEIPKIENKEYALEFFLCGSLADDIIDEIKDINYSVLDGGWFYAFRFRASSDGKFSIERFFPDYETNFDKYILLAAKDNDEREVFGQLIAEKFKDVKITKFVDIIQPKEDGGFNVRGNGIYLVNNKFVEVNFPPVPTSWPMLRQCIISNKDFGERVIYNLFAEAAHKDLGRVSQQSKPVIEEEQPPKRSCTIS
jgi:hypothetical protein